MGFQLEHIKKVKETSKINEVKTSILTKELAWFGTSFSNKIKEDFYIEISVMLKAGISLKDGLELIEKSHKKRAIKETLNEISNSIIAGSSLSDAIKRHKEFTNYEYYSLKIGEETGTLFQVMEQLGGFYFRKNEQRRTVISALTYPVIILSTAVLVVGFMLHFVVPMFQDIFEQQQVELPGITLFIIKCSQFMKRFGWLVLLIIGGLFFLKTFFKNKVWYKTTTDKMASKIPFLGGFLNTVYLSQFIQAVALLTASKVPMVNSIQLVKKMIQFHPLQQALEAVEKDLLKGQSLSVSLASHSLFDATMVAMVKVAEETNQNAFIFERLNMQYTQKVQQKSKLISTLMEPIIILVVGVLVGVILIAMYLPMFKLSNVLG